MHPLPSRWLARGLLLAALFATASPTFGADPRVRVEASAPRFDDVAERAAEEIRGVLQADDGAVIVGSSEDDSEEAVRIVVDPLSDAVLGPDRLARDLEAFRRLVPGLRGIVAPVDPWLVERFADRLEAAGARVFVVPEGASPDEILDALGETLDDDADGVYLPPGAPWPAEPLAAALIERDLPGFSGRGRADVEAGWLAGPAVDPASRAARLAALDALDTLRGPVDADSSAEPGEPDRPLPHLLLHEGTALALGLDLPWRVRLDAEIVGRRAADATLDEALGETLGRAVDANLDLRARALAVAASEADLDIALAALRPRLGVEVSWRWIDEESALASFGSQPERLGTLVGEASQVLFSEPARARVDVEERLRLARELEIEQLRLDLARQAGAALLGVTTAEARARIERENLALVRAELGAAGSRRRAGAGDRADVARLEARAAESRITLLEAYSRERAARLRLARLLHRPLDPGPEAGPGERITEPAVDDLPRFDEVSTPTRFATLEAEVLAAARERAPEIAAAGALVEAAERRLDAARRALYLPEVAATARFTTRVDEGGAGTGPPALPLPGASGFPETPDESWSLGLGASLPILTGGRRHAEIARAEMELAAARVRRDAAAERVEERARTALVELETAYESAERAAEAARAAATAFEVVQAAYRRGAATLTTFLDAQTALVRARQRAATATFAARDRWLEVERASGRIDTLDPIEDSTDADPETPR